MVTAGRARAALGVGALGLVLFELANVYFVMPMPGSQRSDSIGLAYALYRARWVLRAGFAAMAGVGLVRLWRAGGRARWWAPPALAMAVLAAVAIQLQMAADRMFLQPRSPTLVPAAKNAVALDRLVLGVTLRGEARAYPIRFLGYHHQIRDTVGGTPVMVTYCTVCRTGRVFSPMVGDRLETFRLVGMDHFNAMFEDAATGSWWRQANGEAIAGPLRGQQLATIPSEQMTLGRWLGAHQGSLILQADPGSADHYPKDDAYERGTSRKTLTGTNTASWEDKSWVVGIEVDGHSKAFDWNRLRTERLVHDLVGGVPVLVVLADDGTNFAAYRRPSAGSRYLLEGGALVAADRPGSVDGGAAPASLPPLAASQEFWHSWRTFHPGTERDL